MTADICLILEGTYPFVRGGVSAWTHELIQRQEHLRFHIVSILPRDEEPEQQYALPDNVTGLTKIHLMRLPQGARLSTTEEARLADALRAPLANLTAGAAHIADLKQILECFARVPGAGEMALLNSEQVWTLVTSMYERHFSESSMLDYFWSWRAVIGGLYSLLLAPLPEARVYHALSTGYAGMMLARAKLTLNRPCLLTEHGIYTNERRVEIALADWLAETASRTLTVDRTRLSLRDFWAGAFANYSRVAYEAADRVITLFSGNQEAQAQDGAEREKMRLIANGVDIQRFGALRPRAHERPTVALIGRVVPIKDIKTYLRAVAALRERLPDLRALVMGPLDEDPHYVKECQDVAQHLGLERCVTFTGQVKVDDYLPEIDLVVFTSLSEAQPLTILEAGACGIPTVATDVGACRELIFGRADEYPRLGAGGEVVTTGNPRAVADAAFRLLTDHGYYQACAAVIRQRVEMYYDRQDQMTSYRDLYAEMM